MEEKIIKIIEKVSDNKDIRDNIDIDLIDSGILDSLAFVELIAVLEDEFSIEIQPTKVDSNSWRTVGAIVELVESLIQ